MKKIVVVGSGFGGLSIASKLKAKKFDVTLIEKHKDLGGRARTFVHNDFKYDAGPTVITAPYLIDELFSVHSEKLSDYVNLLPVKPWYRFLFDSGDYIDYGDKLISTVHEIKAKYGNDKAKAYLKLLKHSKQIFKKGFIELSDEPFESIYSMLKHLPALIKIRFDRSVYQTVNKYLNNKNLNEALSMHPLLVGGNPYSTTSIYLLIQYLEWKWGVYYAEGGTGRIIDGLEKLLIKKDVNIKKNTEAKKIILKNNKVVGIDTSQGIIDCDIVVCNSDPTYTYNNLLGFKPKKASNRFNLKHSMSLFVLYFSTTKIYKDVKHHTIIFSKRHYELLNDIFNKKVFVSDPSLYLHRPGATDPSMIQNGNDTFYVLAPVPNNLSKIDWNDKGNKLANIIIKNLQEKIMPELTKNISDMFFVTPDYFENELNTYAGSGFGIQPIFTQSAYFRYGNKAKEAEGLYFVGASTHPGAGVPGVISTAKVTEKLILKDYGTN
ncbi:MAG: phytoene desaturase family protein [Pseudomonadota bacterium]|nr:phytoene desaturase family protein [Pseudomonadota bacterium]